MIRRAACCLVALLLTASAAGAWTMVDHPRMYLRLASADSAWADTLRTRCTTTHAKFYAPMKALVDTRMGEHNRNVLYAAMAAFVATIEDTQTYWDYVSSILSYNIEPARASVFIGDVLLGYQTTPVVAADWAWDHLSAGLQDSIGTYLGDWLNADHWDDDLGRYPWIPTAKVLPIEILLYGHGYADAESTRFEANREKATYTDTETGLNIGFLSALDVTASGGGISGYSGLRYSTVLGLHEMLRSSIGDDYRDRSDFLGHMSQFWMHRLRPDNQPARGVGKWDVAGNYSWLYHAWVAASYDDALAQGQARRVLADPDVRGNGPYNTPTDVSQYEDWMAILWYQPWLPAASPWGGLSAYDAGSGIINARESWDWAPVPYSASDTTTVIHLSFFNGPDVSGTVAANHFALARGKDALLVGNGQRTSDLDAHFYPYYIFSRGWNCVSIEGPTEDFGLTTAITCVGDTVNIPEDGSQTLGGYISSALDHSCADSAAYYFSGAGNTYGYHGRVTAYRDSADYLWIRGDATAAYMYECSETRASSVTRDLVWARPRWPSDPSIFVVRDRVTRLDEDYTVKARWHVLHRPELAAGVVTRVVGAEWAANLGGVYTTAGVSRLTATRGVSEAQILPVTAATVNLIGGPNSAGANWKQSGYSGCTSTYAAGDPSFEFWAEGANWPPQHDSSTRFSTAGNEAGDWTIECQAPDTGLDVDLVTVFVVGDSAQAAATATMSGDVVTVEQDTTATTFTFDADGFVGLERGGVEEEEEEPEAPPAAVPRGGQLWRWWEDE